MKIFFSLNIRFSIILIFLFAFIDFDCVNRLRRGCWIQYLSIFFEILSKFDFNLIVILIITHLIFNLLLRCENLILFAILIILDHCAHLKLWFVTILYFLIHNVLYVADRLHLLDAIIYLVWIIFIFDLLISS